MYNTAFASLLNILALSVLLLSCTQSGSSQANSTTQVLSPVAFKQKADSLPMKYIVDVRTPEEYAHGHIEGAVNINIYDSDFESRINSLDKTKPVLVYCKSGGRSNSAVKAFAQAGFNTIYDLRGGLMAWQNNNLPLSHAGSSVEGQSEFTYADFQKLLSTHSKILIDYHAAWCAPCKKMEPALKKLSDEYKGRVHIVRIDVDKAKQLSKLLNIEALPLIEVYENQRLMKRITGYQSEEALRMILEQLQ
ncbi:MAG: thioredoxin domain-containing protein [Cytophagaceae bacterium]|nr:thioredoxin domain-containing protein [Cytophagaceae bacterium]MDW8455752.1 thioredoxin domain-containing protein [Cytophagaceae bacterium]